MSTETGPFVAFHSARPQDRTVGFVPAAGCAKASSTPRGPPSTTGTIPPDESRRFRGRWESAFIFDNELEICRAAETVASEFLSLCFRSTSGRLCCEPLSSRVKPETVRLTSERVDAILYARNHFCVVLPIRRLRCVSLFQRFKVSLRFRLRASLHLAVQCAVPLANHLVKQEFLLANRVDLISDESPVEIGSRSNIPANAKVKTRHVCDSTGLLEGNAV